MGYDLHITRKDDWSDDDKEKEIALSEWLAYIDADQDLVLSDGYRIKVPGSDTESMAAPGYCEWTSHPSQERPCFDYWRGCISTKNPDEDVTRKMLSIAEVLGAKVQGDDGEIYTLSADNQILTGYPGNEFLTANKQAGKPWWKFW
jgi:hypothetical protein